MQDIEKVGETPPKSPSLVRIGGAAA